MNQSNLNQNKRKNELIRRFEGNLAGFYARLEHLSRSRLISLADRIAAVTDIYEYVTKHYDWYDDGEVQYMLLFADPLMVMADIWQTHRADISDADMVVWEVLDNEGLLADYPLTVDAYGYASETR